MDHSDIINRFTAHPPNDEETGNRFESVRDVALCFAVSLNKWCPEGREKSLAITKLEEVVFWANAAIARNQG